MNQIITQIKWCFNIYCVVDNDIIKKKDKRKRKCKNYFKSNLIRFSLIAIIHGIIIFNVLPN